MTPDEIAIELHNEGACNPEECPYCSCEDQEAQKEDIDESTEA